MQPCIINQVSKSASASVSIHATDSRWSEDVTSMHGAHERREL